MITTESASAYHEWLMPGPQTAKSPFPLEHEAPSRKFDTEAALDEQEGGCPAGGPAVRDVRGAVPGARLAYLLEEWLPDNQPPRLRPSSFASFTIYTRTHAAGRVDSVAPQV